MADLDPESRRLSREDVGSWLQGPTSSTEPLGGYRGDRLGLPDDGPGAVAGFGRRVAALFIDWFAAVGAVLLFLPEASDSGQVVGREFATLAVFALQLWIGISLTSASLGKWILGMRVVRLDGRPIGPARALVRTVLLCLVIPAAILDRDARGLHDKAVGSVVVSAR